MVQPPQLVKTQLPAHNRYWFILGHQPILSLIEIEKLYNTKYIKYNQAKHLAVFYLKNLNPKKAIATLGGTIKIAQQLDNNLTDEILKEKIINELKNITGKIYFGLSYYGNKFNLKGIQRLGLDIKTALKKAGCSVRFVQNKDIILSSATVKNNKLDQKGREFLIYEEKDKYNLAVTQAIQPFDKFSERDYGRPNRDDFSGMLPPKLAMIMINLSQTKHRATILDPFCGSGTILTEAMLMGYTNLIGTDISTKAIKDTKQNITWTINSYKLSAISYKLYNYNVKNLSNKLKRKKVNTIITEPYMGRPLRGRETKEELQKQTKELKEFYLSTFAEFKKILKSNGLIIFIIPRFKIQNDWIIINCIEKIKKLGFISEPLLDNQEYILYHRPNQYIGREIWRFRKI